MQLRTVFDSNVYIAAALKPGAYSDLFLDIAALPGSDVRLFISKAILAEVRATLVELGLPPAEAERFVQRLRTIATPVRPTERVHVVRDDPDDNAILECALAANAQLIISADNHLLKLSPYRGIGIAHPRELRRIFASDFRRAA